MMLPGSAAVMFQYYLAKHPSVTALAHLDEPTRVPLSLRVSSEDLWATCFCRVIEVLIKRRDYPTLDRVLSWASVLPWVVEVPYRRRMITHLYISNALQVCHGETVMEAMRQIEKEVSSQSPVLVCRYRHPENVFTSSFCQGSTCLGKAN